MKKFFTVALITFAFIINSHESKAQLYVDTSYTVTQMVTDFFGNSCTAISNITFQGTQQTMNFFDGSNSNVGLTMGILLTSGTVLNAVSNNTSNSITSVVSSAGDTSLNYAGTTYDASFIEFDIVPTVDTIFFQYVFGSDEYPEFVNSNFNDAFGFFISGPGITGTQNIALIPGTSTTVSINNVNCGLNDSFYVCNEIGSTSFCPAATCPLNYDSTTIEYDGFTTPVTCFAVVMQDSLYHVKITVADVADFNFDSGIFLSCESLCGDGMLPHPIFIPDPVGGDTLDFENNSIYGVSYFWDFGDGVNFSNEINPTFHYSVPGTYTVTLTATNGYGSASTSQVVVIEPNGTIEITPQFLSVTPNPAIDILNISIEGKATASLSVYDITGKLVHVEMVKGNCKLDVAAFEKGIYILKAETADGVFVSKFVKE